MYLNRITLIGFLGGDAERKVSNATNIAVFSLATKTSWKNDGGTWESRTEWHRCVAFGKLAEFAATLSKGAHIAVEGELRSHEYPREIAVGPQTTSIPQRVWEIRVNSVLKLDRAAHRGSHDDSHEEAPVKGRFLGCWEMSTHRTTSWESTLPRPFSPSADRHRPSGMAPTHGERNRRKLDHSLPLRIPPEIAYGSSPLCLGAASWAATRPRRGPSRSIGIEVEEVTRYILKLGNAQSLSGNVAATATGRLLRMEDETCSARP
jgi:single-strand DNA-binding protein